MTEPRRSVRVPPAHPRRNPVMPDRAGLELRVEPEPVRRTHPAGDGRPGMVFIWLGVIVVVIAVVVVIVALASSAASRGAQTTDLAPSHDLPATPGPSAGLPGAPHVGERLDPGDGIQLGRSSEGSRLRRLTAGGAPRFRGLATWFCLSGSSACTTGYDQADLVAAIDTDLGFAKGDQVRVRYGDRSVVVTVVDVCGCPGDRLVDLTSGAFRELADLDLGVIPVTVELAGPGATLPATEEAP